VQILFVPQRVNYEMTRMTDEEATQHLELERTIDAARFDIAEHTWHNPVGMPFTNHYKVLARAFARDGRRGVQEVVDKALERIAGSFPRDKPIAECMAVAAQRVKENKNQQAKDILRYVLERDPNNAAAYCGLSVCLCRDGNSRDGLQMMMRAAALEPSSAQYHIRLGELLRGQGRLAEAEASYRTALPLTNNDPGVLSVLGLTLAHQGRAAEALEMYHAALASGVPVAPAHFGIGMILARQGQYGEARARFEAALAIEPNFAGARQALLGLPVQPPR
jgi:Tfp pilus assembly protein PilF